MLVEPAQSLPLGQVTREVNVARLTELPLLTRSDPVAEDIADGGIVELALQLYKGVTRLHMDNVSLRGENALLREELGRLAAGLAPSVVADSSAATDVPSAVSRQSGVPPGDGKRVTIDEGAFLSANRGDDLPCTSCVTDHGRARYSPARPRHGTRVRASSWSAPSNMFLRRLDYFVACAVLLNVLLVGLQTVMDSPLWGWIDVGFVFMFTLEMTAKLYYSGFHKYFVASPEMAWNTFDASLVVLAILDMIVQGSHFRFTNLRFLRLNRIARVVRLVRLPLFEDLDLILRRLITGLRSLRTSMILFMFVVWSMAVTFATTIGQDMTPDSERFEGFQDERSKLFGDAFKASFTVFRCVNGDCNLTNGDPWVPLFADIYGASFIVPFVFFTIVVLYGILNLIMAIFIEKTLREQEYVARSGDRQSFMPERQ
eukprot:TRINITY_DN3621_c0_g2_i1.p1 TRINITY_DN3621_c0_g2~~TRINITY_DN3621_c0_g2_i1.p1  ORF type:complete len:442 (+),score=56.96 TRINITY_DN3621_c0_g2_i1:40-1326(+)